MTKFNNTNKCLKFISLVLLVISGGAISTTTVAQSFSLGADIMSRYVWRGTDFGNSASIQPGLEFSSGGFTLGSWASYAVSPVDNNVASGFGASEHDLYIGYAVDTGSESSFSFGITDYYFSNAGVDFFDFDDGGAGAHQIEPYVSYTGPVSFPITLYGSIFAYNEPDNSIYLELGVPVYSAEGVDVGFTIGGTPQESAFYGTNKAGIINMSLTASKKVAISSSFVMPLSASYIMNPYMEKTYLVFGFSL